MQVILILPLVLFIVMTEVSIGSVIVLVLLDWRNEVKRGFLTSYAMIYLCLAGLTYLLQQNFATPQLLNTFSQLDKAWIPYQSLPLLLFFLLMIPYNVLLWVDKRAGVDGKPKLNTGDIEDSANVQDATPQVQRPHISRILRLIVGGLLSIAGLATILVMAMIYRPLAAMNFGGVFTVAGFFAAALALGGVLTAMWLGHWYLVTPALSEKPLQFATTLVLLGVLAQVIFAFSAGPVTTNANAQGVHSATSGTAATSTFPTITAPPKNTPQQSVAGTPVITPLSTDAIGWVRILVSFIMPLVLGGLAWKLIRDRSFQSATGMLYLVVVCSLAGEAMARGLFLVGL